MMIHESVRVLVREPGSSQAVSKHCQDRLFFEYRNKGFGLFLRSPSSGSSPPLPSTHGFVVETFSQLRALQRHYPSNIYDIGMRPSYHIPTYQTFLGVVADPCEPFYSYTDAMNHKEFYHHLTFQEREWIHSWAKTTYGGGSDAAVGGGGGRRPHFVFKEQQLRVDCVAISADCAALVTSCGELTEQFLLDFSGLGHLTFAFLGRCEKDRYKDAWGRFFSPRKYTPRLYIGVGTSEFGNGDVTVDTPQLSAMVKRVAAPGTMCAPHPPMQCTIPADLRAKASKLGITLLQRHEMRYFVVRG